MKQAYVECSGYELQERFLPGTILCEHCTCTVLDGNRYTYYIIHNNMYMYIHVKTKLYSDVY